MKPRPARKTLTILKAGHGIGKLVVRRSSATDVERTYGKPTKLIKHGSFSYQMLYAKKGLSFYYCVGDKKKLLFLIHAGPPGRFKTARGVIAGQHTLADAAKIHGEPRQGLHTTDGGKTHWIEYPGVHFHIKKNLSKPRSLIDDRWHLGRKIVSIEIVPVKFFQCDIHHK